MPVATPFRACTLAGGKRHFVKKPSWPWAFWLGQSWVETALLAGTVLLVMIVELLNTGIESAVDRIGPEWHDLSKRAKDMGSAAVLLSLLLCAGVWLAALWQRFAWPAS
jgi:diacylglycerol kinase (ATP)